MRLKYLPTYVVILYSEIQKISQINIQDTILVLNKQLTVFHTNAIRFLELEIVIFYVEMMIKVVLLYFFTSETSEKSHNSTFQVKTSVLNVFFSNEMEK